MKLIEQLGIDFMRLIEHLLSPQTLSTVIAVGTLMYQFIKKIRKDSIKAQAIQQEKIDRRLKTIEKNLKKFHDDTTKEVLRIQLLDGMESRRLSASEVSYFYDRYKAHGGNSFVSAKVREYLKEMEDQS